jgi:hypothetical protein
VEVGFVVSYVCIWGEIMIDISKTEWMMGDLKNFFFKTLYFWTTAFDSNISSFHVFLSFFLLLVRCISCILPVYLGCVFCAFK